VTLTFACDKGQRIFLPAFSRDFVFGLDGKPFYVSGPEDSPGFIRRVLRTLERHCGPDGFHYLTTPAF
jgi:hypothetical protein